VQPCFFFFFCYRSSCVFASTTINCLLAAVLWISPRRFIQSFLWVVLGVPNTFQDFGMFLSDPSAGCANATLLQYLNILRSVLFSGNATF